MKQRAKAQDPRRVPARRLIERLVNNKRVFGDGDLADMPYLGKLFAREPRGWRAQSMQQLGELDDAYMAAKTLQNRLEAQYKAADYQDKGVRQRLNQIDNRLKKLEPYHNTLSELRKTYRRIKEERDKPHPDHEWIKQRER